MHEVEITYDADKVARVYQRYFIGQRNKALRHGSVLASLIAGCALILIGVVLSAEVIIYIGVIAVGLVSMWLFYSIIRLRVGINKILRHYEKYDNGELRFTFAFDNDGFAYRQPDVSSEFKWAYVAKHETNGNDTYLYDKQGNLTDIISSDIIGEEQYKRFVGLLLSKLHCGSYE